MQYLLSNEDCLLPHAFVSHVSLMGSRPSRKIERHPVANSRTFLKEHLATYPNPFHGGAHEGYNDKSIEHLHLYAYEETSRHHHYIFQLPMLLTALALRRFIRAIFSPFLYKFDPHIHPTCYVQRNDFD